MPSICSHFEKPHKTINHSEDVVSSRRKRNTDDNIKLITEPSSVVKEEHVSHLKNVKLNSKLTVKEYNSIADAELKNLKKFQKVLVTNFNEAEKETFQSKINELYDDGTGKKEVAKFFENKPCFVYNLSSKEKREYFSFDKHNIYQQSEFIGKSNPEGVYKFRDIIYEKFGANKIRDFHVDPEMKPKKNMKENFFANKGKKILNILSQSNKILQKIDL